MKVVYVLLSLCSDNLAMSHFEFSNNEHTGNVDEIIPRTFQDRSRIIIVRLYEGFEEVDVCDLVFSLFC